MNEINRSQVNPQKLFYDLSLDELVLVLDSWGEPSYRALQIWRGAYQQLWFRPDHFTNLPNLLREKLFSVFSFEG
ncbi:MAG: hypothetical protein PHQ40_16820, partial [Anaerolineaceae bacterium]|nr:hypothetical protein [Anaerolineaceae bacterium]